MNYLFTKTPLLFFVQNLWRDEAFSYVLAQKNVLDILKLTAVDFNPPLYYILLHFWMMIFGTSEIAMRSLSLLFFLGTLFIIYEILTLVFKIPRYRAIIYFILIVVNPFLITFAFEARMYMMVTFLVTLSYYALWTHNRNLYIAAITLAIYTHYFAVFILAIQFLIPFIELCRETIHLLRRKSVVHKIIDSFMHHRKKILTWKNLQSELWYFFIPILLFLPWAVYLLIRHDFSDGSFWIIEPPLKDLWFMPFTLYTGYERIFGEYYHDKAGYTPFHNHFAILLWLIILAGVAITLFRFYKTKKINLSPSNHMLTLTTWAFFPPLIIFIISFITQPLYLPRYFIFSSVGLILLLIVCFEEILAWNKKKQIISLIIGGILFIQLAHYTNVFNDLNLQYHSKRTIERFYDEISVLKNDHDKIYLTSELDYFLALYYFKTADTIYIYKKTYEEIPMFVGKVLIPESTITSIMPTYPSKAFIVYYNWFTIQSAL